MEKESKKWAYHRLDYKDWEPEISTNVERGIRCLHFYDAMYRASFRFYWPYAPKTRITIEECRSLFKAEFDCDPKIKPTTGAFHQRLIHTRSEERLKEFGNEQQEVDVIVMLEWSEDAYRNSYLISNLVHEIGHMVFSVLKERGMKHRRGGEEAYTYLLTYYTRVILDALTDPFQAYPEDYAI